MLRLKRADFKVPENPHSHWILSKHFLQIRRHLRILVIEFGQRTRPTRYSVQMVRTDLPQAIGWRSVSNLQTAVYPFAGSSDLGCFTDDSLLSLARADIKSGDAGTERDQR
jgi:hypothetical protein